VHRVGQLGDVCLFPTLFFMSSTDLFDPVKMQDEIQVLESILQERRAAQELYARSKAQQDV
jgi:hypothetical protein